MVLKSIRWRLQIWYGLILIGVLAGFGATAYQLQRGKQFRRIDEELQRRVGELASAMRLPPLREPGRPGPSRLGGREPLPGRPPPPELPPPGQPGPDRPFPEGRPDGFPRGPTEFHLQPQQAGLF